MELDKESDKEEDVDMVSVSETTESIRPYIPPIQVPIVVEETPFVYCGVRLVTSEYDHHLYGIPPLTCFHARTIWLQAGLPLHAVARFLEIKMIDWACIYAQLDIQGEEIRSVRYQTSSDCLYFCSWGVFLRWMMLNSLSTFCRNSSPPRLSSPSAAATSPPSSVPSPSSASDL